MGKTALALACGGQSYSSACHHVHSSAQMSCPLRLLAKKQQFHRGSSSITHAKPVWEAAATITLHSDGH